METTQEGILVTDLEGKITFANNRIADALGYTVEELIGKLGLESAAESEKAGPKRGWKNALKVLRSNMKFG